jgi:hypothetical protein
VGPLRNRSLGTLVRGADVSLNCCHLCERQFFFCFFKTNYVLPNCVAKIVFYFF